MTQAVKTWNTRSISGTASFWISLLLNLAVIIRYPFFRPEIFPARTRDLLELIEAKPVEIDWWSESDLAGFIGIGIAIYFNMCCLSVATPSAKSITWGVAFLGRV
jgi:hypothetical protein